MAAESVTHFVSVTRTVEQVAEQPFYIPMTGPSARPRRSLKHDDTFIVLDSHGDIGASAGGPDGLFHHDTRYLARLELVLNDLQPLLLGSNMRDDNSALTVDLTNPDIYRQGSLVLQKDLLHIVRTIFLWRGTAYQRIGVQNHGDRPVASARASCSGRPTCCSSIVAWMMPNAPPACISTRVRRGCR